ncbi:hypothetical protein GW17_00019383 [Ensete ventricosum]|nr:hypothetical protein GW17_00019383 [Ensete ventricosum]
MEEGNGKRAFIDVSSNSPCPTFIEGRDTDFLRRVDVAVKSAAAHCARKDIRR